MILQGPNNGFKYLRRAYGIECFYKIINNQNHHPKIKIYLKIEYIKKREVVYPTIKLE